MASGETSRLSTAPPSAVAVCTRMSRGQLVPRETAEHLGRLGARSGAAPWPAAPVSSWLAALATASALPVSASVRSACGVGRLGGLGLGGLGEHPGGDRLGALRRDRGGGGHLGGRVVHADQAGSGTAAGEGQGQGADDGDAGVVG